VRYIQCLLAEGLVTIPGILRALWRVSTFQTLAGDSEGDNHTEKKDISRGKNGKEKQIRKRWINSYETEETLFYRLTKHIASGSSPNDIQEITELIHICIQWMSLVVSLSAETTSMLHPTQTQEIAAQNMALGTLVVALVENAKVQRALSKGSVTKATTKELEKTLGAFITLLMQSSPQIAARLEIFRTETLVALLPVDAKEKGKDAERRGAEKEMDDILEGGLGMSPGLETMVVEDIPSMNARAGLYVYLNSLVSVSNEA
jgi:mediator of RNA polymerase II transcription subunit 5